jgi:hypothetical protein
MIEVTEVFIASERRALNAVLADLTGIARGIRFSYFKEATRQKIELSRCHLGRDSSHLIYLIHCDPTQSYLDRGPREGGAKADRCQW